MNHRAKHVPLRANNDKRVPFMQMGWEDARTGQPFRYDVGYSIATSSAYENGRTRVFALRAQGLPVPTWNAAHTVPPKVRAAINLADAYILARNVPGHMHLPQGPKGWGAAA